MSARGWKRIAVRVLMSSWPVWVGVGICVLLAIGALWLS